MNTDSDTTKQALYLTNDELRLVHRALCKLDDSYTDAVCAARSQDSLALYTRLREGVRVVCRRVANQVRAITGTEP